MIPFICIYSISNIYDNKPVTLDKLQVSEWVSEWVITLRLDVEELQFHLKFKNAKQDLFSLLIEPHPLPNSVVNHLFFLLFFNS